MTDKVFIVQRHFGSSSHTIVAVYLNLNEAQVSLKSYVENCIGDCSYSLLAAGLGELRKIYGYTHVKKVNGVVVKSDSFWDVEGGV